MVAFTGTQRRKAGRIVHIADFIDALKHKGNKRAQIRTAGGKGNFGYDGDKQRGTANFRHQFFQQLFIIKAGLAQLCLQLPSVFADCGFAQMP